MNCSGQLSVDFHFGVGHRTFENDVDGFSFPRIRNSKFVFVKTCFIIEFKILAVGNVIPSVVVRAKSLLFPL
ncbi:hypothetical protein D3C86_1663320 [compost metagenome]